jgi:5-methylthioadenosine/S-adenosylhomocysteine deaminase
VNGAEALGLGTNVGSLTPGKQADIVLIGDDALNMTPLPNPAGSAVVQANSSNVDTVIVAGRVVKRGGRLLEADTARARRLIGESCERVFAAVAAKGPLLPPPQPGFTDALNQLAETNLAQAGVAS